MNWSYEQVDALPRDVFDQLIEMLKREADSPEP